MLFAFLAPKLVDTRFLLLCSVRYGNCRRRLRNTAMHVRFAIIRGRTVIAKSETK